jgi:hypothetical protein
MVEFGSVGAYARVGAYAKVGAYASFKKLASRFRSRLTGILEDESGDFVEVRLRKLVLMDELLRHVVRILREGNGNVRQETGLPNGNFAHQKISIEDFFGGLEMKNVCLCYNHLGIFYG